MWLPVICFLVAFVLLLYLDTRKPKNYPPGPVWLPIIGSSLTVKKIRNETGYLFKACSALAEKYGPVVGLKIGKDRHVVCNDFESAREFLINEDLDGRPDDIFYRTRTWGERLGLLVVDSHLWHEQRKFVLRQLREFGFGRQTMAGLVEDEASELVKFFKVHAGSTGFIHPMRDAFGIYVLNTLWTMMAGIRYEPKDKEVKTLQTLLTDLLASVDMIGCAFSQFPLLRFIAPEASGYKNFLQTHQRIWAFLRAELAKHKETFKPGEPRDLMDVYLDLLQSKDHKESFSESQLLALVMDMFIAGSETTSKSLGFGFLYLVLEENVQRKAQAELDAVVGRDRPVTLADRPNLPYLEAITLESIRMFMGRGFAIPHRALCDTKLQGHTIPKDTMVIVNLNPVLMDKNYWGDPLNFRPERFIDKNGNLSVPERYIPFGFGKHRCMGEVLAKANVFIFIARLLQNFNFSPVPGKPLPTTECIDGVTSSPYPFDALVTPRE